MATALNIYLHGLALLGGVHLALFISNRLLRERNRLRRHSNDNVKLSSAGGKFSG